MFKILIVDDEPWQVKTLAAIIRNMRTSCEVFEASSGQDAIDFLALNTVDVVITDIRMPGMSGLKMIEEIARTQCKPEVVILSGYGEFQYARQALNFGVFEYLLKPISKGDIENILGRLEKKVEQKRTELFEKNNILKKLENTTPVYIEHKLNRWVVNDFDENDEEEMLRVLPAGKCSNVLVTRISKYKRMLDMYKGMEVKKILNGLKTMMKEVLNPIGESISFFSEKSQNIMITIVNSNDNYNLASNRNGMIIKGYLERAKDEYGLTLTVGIGEKMSDVTKDLSKCYEQAMDALDYSFILDNGDIIYFSDVAKEKSKTKLDIYSFGEELCKIALNSRDGMTAKIVNDTFEKYIGRVGYIKNQRLKENLYYIAMNVLKVVKNVIVDEHYEVLVETIRDDLFESDNYKELKYIFIDTIVKLTGYMNNKENSNNFAIVQKCKKYINENYADDISLDSVSNKFFFSPAYFSNIFKSYTGIGFSEYLTNVRIQKAQYLLKNTDYKIYDISEKVGYNDAAYFNRIFKREVGVSPYKFRQISSEV